MKNLKQLFIALLLLCSMAAMAETVTIDGITYDVITKGKAAIVIERETGKYSGSVVIPESIVHNNVTCIVTTIGDNAFYYCSGLTSITIPYSVTSIGNSAFRDCFRLTSVTIGNSVTSIGYSAFYGCSSLTSITIPNSVTSIGDYAFYDCSGLTSITIPNSVTSIGDYAFYDCSGLTSVTIPNCVTSIGSGAFYGCSGLTSITIPNSVTSIGSSAFAYCSSLTSITIPNSVTSIGYNAFEYCSGLTSITIPNSVTSIGNSAFSGCSGLTSVTIPNSVTSIGNYAFEDCSGLEEVHISDLSAWCNIDFDNYASNPLYYAHNLYLNGKLITDLVIPDGVTSIGYRAFQSCSGLTSITIPNSVTSIGNYAFDECSGLTSVTIPNSVTSIGSGAFYGCSGLTSITIPNSVTSIGNYAFEGCSGLTSITIPNSVTSIGSKMFYGCSGLTSITIGSGVKSIASSAFTKCSNLTDVYCIATKVPSATDDAFNESYPEYMTLHVPAEAINDYKTTAPWSSFGTIVTLDGEVVEPEEPEKPEEPEVKICETPVISYNNGKLVMNCETVGAEFITDVRCSDIKKFYDSEINFSATYNISVYATATDYENSETVNATLCWIENGDSDEDDTTNIITVPAVAVLVTSANGAVTVNCSLEGESVEVYTTDGTLVGSAAITNGSATIQSGLSKGSIVIVKIGAKSVKIVVD